MQEKTPFKPRALGEIAIRCADMDTMVAFYRDVIGLDVINDGHRSGITFLRIGEQGSGFGGHTPVIALFRH
ncbi:MAG TPA: VOC family protein, partial [Aliiroseovarius sp.]|nr:VOC family protein [Aliiroseovarius sp.]